MQALGESEFLRAELDDLRRVKEDTEKEQRSLTEIESESRDSPGTSAQLHLLAVTHYHPTLQYPSIPLHMCFVS